MASTNALILPAQNAGATNTADIRGIKGPVYIPSSYAWVWWVLLAALVAAAIWYAWRRLRLRKQAAKPVVIIPPHRKAKDKLRTAGGLMSDPYAFCSLVSDVLRVYVEDRFELHAPDRTTEEFLEEMRSTQKLHPRHKELLEDFLLRCDLVKFARFEPTLPELQGMLDAALRFIDETAPVEASGSTEVVQQQAA